VCVCTVPGLGEASRQLVIIPDDETFVKPLGASMVLTCRVVTSDGHRPPGGSQLQWIDDDNQAIVDINGRFHPACYVLCYMCARYSVIYIRLYLFNEHNALWTIL